MSIIDLPLTSIGKYVMLTHKGSESMDALWFRILITALNAVLPIILMIALGYLLRQKGFFGDKGKG